MNIEDLAKGKGADYRQVIQSVCAKESAKDLRHIHRHQWNGFDKKKNVRLIAKIPLYEYLFSPYFSQEMDRKERDKHITKFLEKHPEYKAVDKL